MKYELCPVCGKKGLHKTSAKYGTMECRFCGSKWYALGQWQQPTAENGWKTRKPLTADEIEKRIEQQKLIYKNKQKTR